LSALRFTSIVTSPSASDELGTDTILALVAPSRSSTISARKFSGIGILRAFSEE
jgi:hypothetical protein